MPKVIISIDEVVIKEAQLTKDKTTLGRRPYNDIVIDHLAVSGEHAMLQMIAGEVFLEDLHSTNGSYLNGKAVKKEQLQHGDTIAIGKYKIKFVTDSVDHSSDKTMAIKARPAPPYQPTSDSSTMTGPDSLAMGALQACIKVLSGAVSGREVALTKVVTTVGKPGVAVAAITRRKQGFVVHHVEGAAKPMLNGAPISEVPMPLKSGDVIELAGTQMQFIQA